MWRYYREWQPTLLSIHASVFFQHIGLKLKNAVFYKYIKWCNVSVMWCAVLYLCYVLLCCAVSVLCSAALCCACSAVMWRECFVSVLYLCCALSVLLIYKLSLGYTLPLRKIKKFSNRKMNLLNISLVTPTYCILKYTLCSVCSKMYSYPYIMFPTLATYERKCFKFIVILQDGISSGIIIHLL